MEPSAQDVGGRQDYSLSICARSGRPWSRRAWMLWRCRSCAWGRGACSWPFFAKLSSALIGGAFGGALAARVETVAFDLALAALYAGSIHRARLVSSACCCGDGHAVRKDADRGDVIVEGNKRGGSTDIEGESCVAKPEAASRVQGRQSVTFKEASGSSRMKQRADRKPQGQQLARSLTTSS